MSENKQQFEAVIVNDKSQGTVATSYAFQVPVLWHFE